MDTADDGAKAFAMGRDIKTGAPLTGTAEHDLKATDKLGFPAISEVAHIRLARAADPSLRMLRRGYNYAVGVEVDGAGNLDDVCFGRGGEVGRRFSRAWRSLGRASR
jgi:dye decolorizing peroxidase